MNGHLLHFYGATRIARIAQSHYILTILLILTDDARRCVRCTRPAFHRPIVKVVPIGWTSRTRSENFSLWSCAKRNEARKRPILFFTETKSCPTRSDRGQPLLSNNRIKTVASTTAFIRFCAPSPRPVHHHHRLLSDPLRPHLSHQSPPPCAIAPPAACIPPAALSAP